MSQTERLFLLDGMALAYRAYFSFIARPLINSKGINTSAIYGFVTALTKILDDEKPEHIAVVFDTKEPTFRHKKYPDYKATRQKMPEDMSSQLDKLKEVVRAFNVPSIELPGYEADDIIGTLARRAEKEGVITYMVTADKDFMQLISPKIKMYKPGKAGGEVELIDEAAVQDKFGVGPKQIIEILGLIGDSSDNIPGVAGIGPKTATPLIQRFGTIPALYEHLDEVPQKGVREKLAANRDMAFLSRELVTIHTEVPVPVDFHQLKASKVDATKLIRLFDELEFKTLANRVRNLEQFAFESQSERNPADAPPGEAMADRSASGPSIDITSDDHQYHCITDLESLKSLCRELVKAPVIVIDTETTSQNAFQAGLVGISISIKEREAYYIPVKRARQREGELFADSTASYETNHTASALDCEQVLGELKPILENTAIGKIGQNIKYDMLVLRTHGVLLQGVAFDTMVASYVLRADGQHNLDALAMEYLNYNMISFDELVGKGKREKHITEVSLDAITQYSAQDADITMRVYSRQLEKLKEKELLDLCQKMEFPLISVLERMEASGICLDTDYLRSMSKDLDRQIESLVADIHSLAGETFNINSTQQLGEILFNRLGLRTVRKTKTGFSTDVNVLEELQGEHPVIDRLLEYRQLTKLKSTYIDALPELVHPKTGRVHASFNQTVAATGRLSGSDPNLQNIPIRTELGRAIRKAFIPEGNGWVLISADYSQIELRVMAHISGDSGLLDAFRNKEDIHASTAAKVFGVHIADVTPLMRRKAKEVNFGIMYGIGPFGLSRRLDITQPEAKEIITKYFERFPKVKQYIHDTIATVRNCGYVSTLLGRRRYLPEINSRNQNIRGNAERQAINMPIQGTAADMIKLAMIHIDSSLLERRMKSKMLLQVHDELVFESPHHEIDTVREIVQDRMKKAIELDVPIEVELGFGSNWLEAH
jgi:DNA polymerase-1